MTFRILIDHKALESIRSLSEKSRRIVMEKLKTLQEDLFPGSGKECLHVHGREDTCRLQISRTFTAFYRIHEQEKEVHILAVMSTEQAHKRYTSVQIPPSLMLPVTCNGPIRETTAIIIGTTTPLDLDCYATTGSKYPPACKKRTRRPFRGIYPGTGGGTPARTDL